MLETFAQALHQLGRQRAVVVNGRVSPWMKRVYKGKQDCCTERR